MMRGKFFMKKIKLLVSAFAVALVAMLALAPAAQAQDVPLAPVSYTHLTLPTNREV